MWKVGDKFLESFLSWKDITFLFSYRMIWQVLGCPFLLEVFLVGPLDRKLQITGCNSTGWTPWLHKLSSWSGGRINVMGGRKFAGR